jgi:transposase-like protein
MPGKRYTPEERTAAIDAYIMNGPDYCESEFGVKRATVRQWAKRAGVTLSRARQDVLDAKIQIAGMTWEVRRVNLANELGNTAATALALVQASLETGATGLRNARDAAAVLSTLVDKAQLLSGGATARVEDADTVKGRALAILEDLEGQMQP